MGTSISCAIERRDEPGRWRFVAPLLVRRSYDLFGILAGVGGTGHSPIVPPRGLPADLDPESLTDEDPECYLGGPDEFGSFSRSWLTLAELRSHDWDATLREFHDDVPLARFVEWMSLQETPADDLRIVFGFDS